MLRLVGPFITCLLALASTPAIAQAGATRPSASGEEAAQRTEGQQQPASALLWQVEAIRNNNRQSTTLPAITFKFIPLVRTRRR